MSPHAALVQQSSEATFPNHCKFFTGSMLSTGRVRLSRGRENSSANRFFLLADDGQSGGSCSAGSVKNNHDIRYRGNLRSGPCPLHTV